MWIEQLADILFLAEISVLTPIFWLALLITILVSNYVKSMWIALIGCFLSSLLACNFFLSSQHGLFHFDFGFQLRVCIVTSVIVAPLVWIGKKLKARLERTDVE